MEGAIGGRAKKLDGLGRRGGRGRLGETISGDETSTKQILAKTWNWAEPAEMRTTWKTRKYFLIQLKQIC